MKLVTMYEYPTEDTDCSAVDILTENGEYVYAHETFDFHNNCYDTQNLPIAPFILDNEKNRNAAIAKIGESKVNEVIVKYLTRKLDDIQIRHDDAIRDHLNKVMELAQERLKVKKRLEVYGTKTKIWKV